MKYTLCSERTFFDSEKVRDFSVKPEKDFENLLNNLSEKRQTQEKKLIFEIPKVKLMWVIKNDSLLHTVTVKNIHLPNYQLQLPSTSIIPNDYLIANNIGLFHCLIWFYLVSRKNLFSCWQYLTQFVLLSWGFIQKLRDTKPLNIVMSYLLISTRTCAYQEVRVC